MKPRIADTLKEFGFTGTVEQFRTALAEVKGGSRRGALTSFASPAMRPPNTAGWSRSGCKHPA